MPKIFLSAEWRSLLMLNYPIDAKTLQPYLPVGTELDRWNGEAYVSMVGFRFLNTRVLGCRIPFHTNFDEVNLRFYVRRRVEGEWRRGVVFIKEIVPKRAIAFVARTIYNENYVRLPMRSTVQLPALAQSGTVSYEWKSSQNWSLLSAQIDGEPQFAPSDSEGFFITEHYWGYSRQRDGSTMEYQVEHPPWRLWDAHEVKFEAEVASLYGPEFVDALKSKPTSALVAEGSEVHVRKGVPLCP
jgi:uncharacterized protein YqjF (DUF2071 family)